MVSLVAFDTQILLKSKWTHSTVYFDNYGTFSFLWLSLAARERKINHSVVRVDQWNRWHRAFPPETDGVCACGLLPYFPTYLTSCLCWLPLTHIFPDKKCIGTHARMRDGYHVSSNSVAWICTKAKATWHPPQQTPRQRPSSSHPLAERHGCAKAAGVAAARPQDV